MIPALHIVTDKNVLGRADFAGRARDVIRAGGPAVALHIRGPSLNGRRMYELVRDLLEPARAAGARLLVNDRVDVAMIAGADGAHLGQRSLPVQEARRLLSESALIGCSTHSEQEAAEAEKSGSDYVFVGTIFPSASHSDAEPRGTGLLAACVKRLRIAVIAIGGIDPQRVAEVRGTGAHGVAVISGVWDARSAADAVVAYLNALEARG